MISMRDVTPSHVLDKTKQEVDLLKKFSQTINKDLVDPLSLIIASANWLIWYTKDKNRKINEEGVVSKDVLENLYSILVASKMSLFKCKDLLELNANVD